MRLLTRPASVHALRWCLDNVYGGNYTVTRTFAEVKRTWSRCFRRLTRPEPHSRTSQLIRFRIAPQKGCVLEHIHRLGNMFIVLTTQKRITGTFMNKNMWFSFSTDILHLYEYFFNQRRWDIQSISQWNKITIPNCKVFKFSPYIRVGLERNSSKCGKTQYFDFDKPIRTVSWK